MSRNARSALFVPGDRPERFSKAFASGADQIIIDLEDAVDEFSKARAQDNIADFAQQHPEQHILVRINASDHPQHDADLALCKSCPGITGILLPKAESTEQLAHAAQADKPIWPIIESAQGLANIASLVLVANVERLCLGTVDLSLDMNLGEGPAAEVILDQARYNLLVQSRANGLAAPLDGVFVRLDDNVGLADAAKRSQAMGFSGMLCLHPKQIPIIHQAWEPTAEALAWAKRVVMAANQSKEGAFQLNGQMIDAPVLARAQKLLALAKGDIT